MKKKKGNWITILLVLALLAGLSLLLYPSVSDYWNSFHQTRAIASYVQEVEQLDEDQCRQLWQAAQAYNEALVKRGTAAMSEGDLAQYEQMLNVAGNGVMGYIEIPSIQCSLPIYHGTDDAVLQIAVGHLEWTSLPVGGASTHSVISGHRGLPSAKLFTNLDQLREGDTFLLRVLDQVLTYEVDQILIVEPQDTSALAIVEGQDYCTLVTCTPYGVNTHRLLVRGHRIENTREAGTVQIAADAVQIEPLIVAPIAAIPMLLLLLIGLLVPRKPKRGGDLHEKP